MLGAFWQVREIHRSHKDRRESSCMCLGGVYVFSTSVGFDLDPEASQRVLEGFLLRNILVVQYRR